MQVDWVAFYDLPKGLFQGSPTVFGLWWAGLLQVFHLCGQVRRVAFPRFRAFLVLSDEPVHCPNGYRSEILLNEGVKVDVDENVEAIRLGLRACLCCAVP